ncbi:MAG: hypothetical protein NC299_18360 [Lachnospiraceae bacterium]|nr:hypothetical protein [Lachnospiraceae bacterium]
MKQAMNSTQNKYDEENADNYILRAKSAVVIWYQPMTLIACVRFCEDKNENEYHLYNRCCAFLSPGDIVKVFYTTNAAKGWIMVRFGKPNYLNEYGQQIYDIRNCCDDDDSEACCSSSCCAEAATQQKDKETVTVEEWTERIEGTEDEIREYENSVTDSPFKKSGGE